MKKKLLIVESPAKAKTIKKFLGKGYEVASSFGHVADLPEHELGIDIDKDFTPTYIVPSGKKKIVRQLKQLTDKADEVYLASDEDREGEAIAWHLKNLLKLDDKAKRIVFHEITDKAVKKALENPRDIDENLVNAQQARRLLDRLVGYRLSPVLWKKIKKGLSAGRVQSVALRLLAEKEKEIREFRPEVSFKVEGNFRKRDTNENFTAALERAFGEEKEVKEFLESLEGRKFVVTDVKRKKGRRNPAPPFTTSTLQQEAASKLGFSVSKTMQVAQHLYENGYITYMRTDSVHLADSAVEQARRYISERFGAEYARPTQYKTKSKNAQEAHEAIRPTNIFAEEPSLDKDALRLYRLIWQRTLASQMAPAVLDHTHVSIKPEGKDDIFKAKGEVLVFDGFLKVYKTEGAEETAKRLPALKKGEEVMPEKIVAKQKYTRPPARYNEAALVKKMEELGIGRPSTYAPTISLIQKRGYVEKKSIPGQKRPVKMFEWQPGRLKEKIVQETYGGEKRKLLPTDIGLVVNDFLTKNFRNIIDYGFTARVESQFDKIARGKYDWVKMLREFYKEFEPQVEKAVREAGREKGERLLGTDPETGKKVYAKIGPYGPMVQLGEGGTDEKPKYASLLPGMRINDITLDQALFLFRLPKKLGTHQGEDVYLGYGKYGPYVRYRNNFISIPPHADIFTFDLDDAVALITRKQDADKPVAVVEGLPVYVKSGKYGPYLKWGEMNVKIPAGTAPQSLTEEEIQELIARKREQDKKNTVVEWPDRGLAVRKGGWGRYYIYVDGKRSKILPKNISPENLTPETVEEILKGKKN